MSESLCLKTIYDLRVDPSDDPFRYYLPAYQRGYRWTPTQVTQLLEDMREFTKRENPQQGEFYCLQPLVLRPNNDGASLNSILRSSGALGQTVDRAEKVLAGKAGPSADSPKILCPILCHTSIKNHRKR